MSRKTPDEMTDKEYLKWYIGTIKGKPLARVLEILSHK